MTTSLEIPSIEVLPQVREFIASPLRMFIDGEFVDAADGGTFVTYDPATGGTITEVAEARAEDVDRAVRAANAAFEGPWATMRPTDRGRLLERLAILIEENADELSQLESLDSGKPVAHIRAADLPLVWETLRYYAGWPTKIEGDTLATGYVATHVYASKEPVGVVGAIVPWNFPLCQAVFKIAPALAAGCTVVLKPAEQTPLTAIRLAELINEAEFPKGVVNVCPGFGEVAGQALVEHPNVQKIAFTGSVEVGKMIAREGATSLKRVSLELGGKSPNIIFPDADLEAASEAAASAIFFYTGQLCSAGSRLMVHRDAYDDVVSSVVAHAEQLKAGPGLDAGTTLGPLVSAEQRERVTGYIDRGRAEGASIALGDGGDRDTDGGYFVEPTVIIDAPDEMTLVKEEIFGPVLVAQPFDSVEELAKRANDTEYGLSAGVWTSNLKTAHTMAKLLRSGTVWINCYNYFDAAAPWGGFKLSGYDRDCGREGLEKYLETKVVWTNLE
ncbi:MAG: aldehyde dehydrogenase family protein [Solirubrobacterales bacterium]